MTQPVFGLNQKEAVLFPTQYLTNLQSTYPQDTGCEKYKRDLKDPEIHG